MSGFVDRVRIYSGVLSSSEVSALAAGGNPPGLPLAAVPEPASLLAWSGLSLIGLALRAVRRRKHKLSDAEKTAANAC